MIRISLLFFSLLFIWSGKSSKYFYIYSDELWGTIANASLSKREPTEKHLDRMENGGAGVVMNEELGLYHTDQYQLFEIIFNRARKDKFRRTFDPEMATTFIIPYDFSSDVAYFNSCPKSKDHICFTFRKCPLAPKVEELLKASKYYQRCNGCDHLMMVGMNYAMDHYILKPKCKAFLSGVCQKCTKLAIDDYSFLYGEKQEAITTRGDNWAAVPFPSDFHWNPLVKRPYAWELTERPVFISYLGTTQSFYGAARKLRNSIVHFCRLHVSDCKHQSYSINGTRSNLLVQGHNPHILSTKSIFCFQPIGDLMTRKGLFDGILQGCIPVVFSCLSASCMYTWHWEEDFWKQVIIEFDMDLVIQRKLDPVKTLKDMCEKDVDLIRNRQRLLRSRVFELQYSLVGYEASQHIRSNRSNYTSILKNNSSTSRSHDSYTRNLLDLNNNYSQPTIASSSSRSENNRSSSHIKPEKSTWPRHYEYPFNRLRDAYEIAIDHVLGWHSGEESRARNATTPHCWNGMLNASATPPVCVPIPKGLS